MKKQYSLFAQNGSALIMILVAVALFAALSFAISQQSDSGKALSSEKIRVLASDILDMGNKMSDTIAQLRLRGVPAAQLSFENDIVANYENPACTVDKCKIFAYAGGGRDWEIPTSDVSSGANWVYTGDISIQDVGTDEAELLAILPNVPLPICEQLNKMLGLTQTPVQFNGISANKYVGAFAATAVNLTSPEIDGKPSGCIRLTATSGTAFGGGLPAQFYAYYQVLSAR